MKLYDELKRRGVIKVGVAYVAFAWLVLQVADTVLANYGFSELAFRNVVTVLAIGLLPALIIAWVFEWTPEGIVKDSELPVDAGQSSGNRLNYAIIAVLLAAVVWFAVDEFIIERKPADLSIAVLAFDDMSPAGDQEYFSDGMAEEILNLLAGVEELRVISRSSAFTFKGSSDTLKEIADKLDVTYILEGSVRRVGDTVRITAQLIEATSDRHIWSDTYDRKLEDVFAIQDDVAARVVEQLNTRLLGKVPRAVTIDAESHDLYLKARHILHQGAHGAQDAEVMLNQVLDRNPDYIPAIFELTRVYWRKHDLGKISLEERNAKRRELTERIVEIAPESASAYFALGIQEWMENVDLQGVARYFEKGLRLDSSNVDWLRRVSIFLDQIGRVDEAIAIGNYLMLRDPSCGTCLQNLATFYRTEGRYSEGLAALDDMLTWRDANDNFYWQYGTMFLMAGEPERALQEFDKIGSEGWSSFARTFALHDLGRQKEFDAAFATKLAEESDDEEGIARIYAWIGEADRAFEWLDRAVQAHGPDIVRQINTDYYRNIRSDPRWAELRKRHGYDDEAWRSIEFKVPAKVYAQIGVGPR